LVIGLVAGLSFGVAGGAAEAPAGAAPREAADDGRLEPAEAVDAETVLAEARELFDAGRSEKAAVRLEALLEQQPQHRAALLLLGHVRLAQKKYQHALNAFSEVLLEDREVPEACWGRALALVGLADVPKATEWAKKATELAPDDLRAWEVLAQVYLSEGYLDAPRAEAAYRQMLVLDPDNRTARLGLARALSYQKQIEKAVELLEALAEERPEDWEVQFKLAESYYALRQLTPAEQVLERMLQARPEHAEARRLLEAVRSRRAYQIWIPVGAAVGVPLLVLLIRRLKRGRTFKV
jgi:cytochrome c-type biogenesis protein CcmH/NrfG